MNWTKLCRLDDLIENSGVCAKFGERQIALFRLEDDEQPRIYAIDNWDPIGKANVLSRGILGSIADELVVASPLYKQHFSLSDGRCLENDRVRVQVYATRVHNGQLEIADTPS